MAALARTLYSWVSRFIGSLSVCLGARIVMTVLPASAVLLQYAFCSFSWGNLAIAACVWALQTWIGICFSYHRQLTHKSFKTPKWLVSPWVVQMLLWKAQHSMHMGVPCAQGGDRQGDRGWRPCEPASPCKGFESRGDARAI